MRSRVLIALVLAFAPAAASAAAPAPAVSAPGADASVPMHGPLCVLGHVEILCPYQCDDGVDNDGDGQADHPDDPGCDSPTDDDEASCSSRIQPAHTAVRPHGTGWGTKTSLEVGIRDGCGIVAILDETYCEAAEGWIVQECEIAPGSVDVQEIRGLFACVSSACAGRPSPHVLLSRIEVQDSGLDNPSFSCAYGAPTTTVEFHCELHTS